MARFSGFPEIAMTVNAPVRGAGAAYPLVASILVGIASVVPVYELKPNRIAHGVGVSLLDFPLALALTSILLALLVVSLFINRASGLSPLRSRMVLHLLWLFSGLDVAAVLSVIGTYAEMRVSPATGFWFSLAGAALASRWAKRQLKPSAKLQAVALMVSLTALALAWRYGIFDRFSPYLELRSQGQRFLDELLRHVILSLSAFGCALVVGVAGAVLLSRGKRGGRMFGTIAGVIQNIPSLALFGLLLPAMAALATRFPVLRAMGISGIGFAPAFLALAAYALLPVLLSGAAGLRMVDAGVKDAARGMGMSAAQVLFRVELPLAIPAIAAGARTALVQTIGTTTVAALIGAGGMGYFVFQGVGQAAMDMVIIGVVPIVALSIAADALMVALERMLSSKGGAAWP